MHTYIGWWGEWAPAYSKMPRPFGRRGGSAGAEVSSFVTTIIKVRSGLD